MCGRTRCPDPALPGSLGGLEGRQDPSLGQRIACGSQVPSSGLRGGPGRSGLVRGQLCPLSTTSFVHGRTGVGGKAQSFCQVRRQPGLIAELRSLRDSPEMTTLAGRAAAPRPSTPSFPMTAPGDSLWDRRLVQAWVLSAHYHMKRGGYFYSHSESS